MQEYSHFFAGFDEVYALMHLIFLKSECWAYWNYFF